MAEYIPKQAAITIPVMPKRYRKYQTMNLDDAYEDGWDDALKCIEKIHPADVRPVVRGRWILDSEPGEPWKYKCDQCGEVTNNTCMGKPRYNYCPMCGAMMEENNA